LRRPADACGDSIRGGSYTGTAGPGHRRDRRHVDLPARPLTRRVSKRLCGKCRGAGAPFQHTPRGHAGIDISREGCCSAASGASGLKPLSGTSTLTLRWQRSSRFYEENRVLIGPALAAGVSGFESSNPPTSATQSVLPELGSGRPTQTRRRHQPDRRSGASLPNRCDRSAGIWTCRMPPSGCCVASLL
jgi:hypothetical protein